MDFIWNAKHYHENSDFQYQAALSLLESYNWKGNESVLDVGCGDGKITSELSRKLKKGTVIGIDSSMEMISFSTSKFKNEKNLTFKVCQAESLTYYNEFDVIVSFSCLHWVKKQLEFLQGAKRALKPGGNLLISFYNKHSNLWNAIELTTTKTCWSHYFSGYENPHVSHPIETYQSLCEKVGLSPLILKESLSIAYFKSNDEVENFIASWLPHTKQLPIKLKYGFVKDICSELLTMTNQLGNKMIGVPFLRLDAMLANTISLALE